VGKNNQPDREGGIKIIDPKRIDYTYTNEDSLFDIKSSLNIKKTNENKEALKKYKTEKNIHKMRHDLSKNTKIRAKGRITGGHSKQGHSSVYE